MKKQFLHEQHNRQDKTQKPDYREEIVELGRPKQSNVTERLIKKIQSSSESIAAKNEEINALMSKAKFHHAGRVIKLRWPLEHFAKANLLSPTEPSTKEAYDVIKVIAERDMEKISSAIIKGTVRHKRLFGLSLTVRSVDWECSGLECQVKV
jgi:hypothetical protein